MHLKIYLYINVKIIIISYYYVYRNKSINVCTKNNLINFNTYIILYKKKL